jgi:hypothetical protein
MEEELIKTPKSTAQPEVKSNRDQSGNRVSLLHDAMRMSVMNIGGDRGNAMGVSSDDLDHYLNIISKLTLESSLAKNNHLKSKLARLKEATPYVMKCIQSNKTKMNENPVYNDFQNANINTILSKTKALNTRAKLKLGEVKIIDLSICNQLPNNEKMGYLHRMATSKSTLEECKVEAEKLQGNLLNMLNTLSKKKTFKPYLANNLQQIISENSSQDCLGVLSISSIETANSETENKSSNVMKLDSRQLEQLRQLII